MAIPFYHRLRSVYPSASIELTGPAFLEDLGRLNTFDRFLEWNEKNARLFQEFDLAFCLPASYSAAWKLWRSGIPNRIGFDLSGSGIFHTSAVRWRGRESGKHKSELYLELLQGLEKETAELERPEIAVREKVNLASTPIVLAPGASISLREWPFFPELAKMLAGAFPGRKILVVGSKREKKHSSRFARLGIAEVQDCTGETTLQDVVEICKRAAFVVANDSGVAHLAGTLAGAPTFVILGPGDPDYILPRGPAVMGIRLDGLPCSPCEKAFCRAPYGYQACLKQLSVERVYAALTKSPDFIKFL